MATCVHVLQSLLLSPVNLQPLSNSTVCGNTAASFSCQTTVTGLLEWRDANGNTFSFTSSANNPGATGSLGNISLNLTEESGSTLTSTATIDRVTSDILLFCLNGPLSSSETINVAGNNGFILNIVKITDYHFRSTFSSGKY